MSETVTFRNPRSQSTDPSCPSAAHKIRKLESGPKLASRFCKRSIALRIRHSKMYCVNASSLTLCGRGPPAKYASVCERCRSRYSEPETVIELADWDVNRYIGYKQSLSSKEQVPDQLQRSHRQSQASHAQSQAPNGLPRKGALHSVSCPGPP